MENGPKVRTEAGNRGVSLTLAEDGTALSFQLWFIEEGLTRRRQFSKEGKAGNQYTEQKEALIPSTRRLGLSCYPLYLLRFFGTRQVNGRQGIQ
ncbi:hypothetical protein J21TS7_57020 [Paenibacillus cineris]|uniref:Uncharacterized protein n=1 Tax=Paenibacillus cineris TaxID=237530 RepID=A0ABQ4LLJ3_9BACL|nr:hypothetical protein J21TS7_57020 [Paenibacillus cineris]